MNPNLTTYLAKAHTDELLRRAKNDTLAGQLRERRRSSIAALVHHCLTGFRRSTSARQQPEHPSDRSVTIRFATAGDDLMLRRLAQLDSSSVPPPPVLVAEEGGETRAALSVISSTAVADPFHPTAALVELLRLRAAQLRSAEPPWEQADSRRRVRREPRRQLFSQ